MDASAFWVGFAAAMISLVCFGAVIAALLQEQGVWKKLRPHVHEVIINDQHRVDATRCDVCKEAVIVRR